MRKEDPLIVELVELRNKEDHNRILERVKEIVESGDKENIALLRLLSWPSPAKIDLVQFREFIESSGITHIYSIGCGTGLLEWLMQRVILEKDGKEMDNKFWFSGVTGVEIDFGWWSSLYSPPMFLPLRFIDKDFNCDEKFGTESDLAFFCYFNNLSVFLNYLQKFQGKYVGILGPISNTQFCAPAPLELEENPEMPKEQWQLVQFKPFGFGNVDHLAIYKKREK